MQSGLLGRCASNEHFELKRGFTASEVLDMLANGEDDSLNNANQQELEEESEDEAVVNGGGGRW